MADISIAAPLAGQQCVHKEAGDVTVISFKPRGRPRKDGTQGGYVVFSDMDGVERRARLRDWQKAVQQ